MTTHEFDYDWVIIGSGFGGSASALRLAEKGYRVAVLEKGRRYEDKDLPTSDRDKPRYVWDPAHKLYGIMRTVLFRHVMTGAQTGVGGGSLMYGGVLFRAQAGFYADPQWRGLGAWERTLAPHYAEVERMLGVSLPTWDSVPMGLMRQIAERFGGKDAFALSPTGVFFGEPGKTVDDPYFGGEGPPRTGCMRCGECMGGCSTGAANRLTKNYLWFAEKLGVRVHPEQEVVEVTPLAAPDGGDGYRIVAEHHAEATRGRRTAYTARGVIFAGGAVGTNELLAQCKHGGFLPRISDRLGHLVRTNSEVIYSVQFPEDIGSWRDVTASSRVLLDGDTQIELLTLGPKADAQRPIWTFMPGTGPAGIRAVKWVGQVLRHPRKWARSLRKEGWGARTMLMLVMQTKDNAIRLRAKKRRFGKGYRLYSEADPKRPAPTYIEAGDKVIRWLAERTGGIAQTTVFDAFFGVPNTGHLLGGAAIGADAESGVIDANLHVFGYLNMLVCDASAMPANPGVNPALTITALAEYAMSRIPAAAAGDQDAWPVPMRKAG
ncbi:MULTISPECIES: GMC oxidoreductase [unclassified Aureimonas]|uniref:GMC oxidoreductase n=1 Tax=unclassified Aureimonas TaxID=2615206 RepID=UPI0006F39404|nr:MULTISPECIES: GMC family oxidoreductase [unclassified Aureimonas]KQT68989.1 cholesterol oxidase [Aureimonas sp. Leaf460]KQT69220.1 cholesterol oxidase [Aureimonas sp. Leaf427]